MKRFVAAVSCALVALAGLTALGSPVASATAAPLVVSGDGVGMYPTFDPGVFRYAITTSAGTNGTVSVDAPTGSSVNGAVTDGHVVVTGLGDGDEIAVGFDGKQYGLVYLPADFPTLTVTTHADGLAQGYIGLGLTTFGAGPSFETLIDRNGVPVYLRRGATSDFKRQPNGDLTTFRPTSMSAPASGSDLVTMNEAFQETRRQHMTGGLTDTDNHDAVKLPDGSTILVGYEPRGDPITGYLDATIQKTDVHGQMVFEWSSQGLEHESLNEVLWPVGATNQRIDYAHINSVEEIQDGTHDLLVSFRQLSAVFRIATVAHGIYGAGDIVWRLGGRLSDFQFVSDPDNGPCAQHSASMLLNQPDGEDHVLVFDNGSGPNGTSQPGCVDPLAPEWPNPGISRMHTRIAEWALDTTAHTATLVWQHEPVISDPAPRAPFSFFAGSARRLDNGDTLVNWADERAMLASEVAPDGSTVLWDVHTPDTMLHATRYASYRASLITYTDATAPTATNDIADGATYVENQVPVVPHWACTDRGGSTLTGCTAAGLVGGHLSTAPGPHTVSITARDGAGNTTVASRHYTVLAASRPDGLVRKGGSTSWKGGDVYGSASAQTVRDGARRGHRVTTYWRTENDGARADRFRLVGTAGSSRFKVRYLAAGVDVTRSVVAGTYRSATLTPGHAVSLRVEVTPTHRSRVGGHRTFTLRSFSTGNASRTDAVALKVTRR